MPRSAPPVLSVRSLRDEAPSGRCSTRWAVVVPSGVPVAFFLRRSLALAAVPLLLPLADWTLPAAVLSADAVLGAKVRAVSRRVSACIPSRRSDFRALPALLAEDFAAIDAARAASCGGLSPFEAVLARGADWRSTGRAVAYFPSGSPLFHELLCVGAGLLSGEEEIRLARVVSALPQLLAVARLAAVAEGSGLRCDARAALEKAGLS